VGYKPVPVLAKSFKKGGYVTPGQDELSPALIIQDFHGETALPRTPHNTAREIRADHRVLRPKRLSPDILAWLVAASDFCLVLLAAGGAFAAFYDVVQSAGPGRHFFTAFVAATLFIGGFERLGGYRLRQLSRLDWQVTRVLITWGVLIAVLLFIGFVAKVSESYSRGWTLAWIFAAIGMQLSGRCLLEIAAQRGPQAGFFARHVVIFGAGDEGHLLIAKLQKSQDKSIVIRGIFDDRRSRIAQTVHGVSVLGTSDDLLRFVREVRIDEVIIALPLAAERRLSTLLEKLKGVALDLRLSLEPIAARFCAGGIGDIGLAPVLNIADRPLKHWRAAIKWIEDKCVAVFLLIVLAPLMGLVALLVKLDNRGPVLFIQRRYGFNNEEISVFKFRTMSVDQCDGSGRQRTVLHDPRVTRVGRIIRALSIDELPQLINVLRGEMSIVGPRPHPIAMMAGEDTLYGEAVTHYFHRHRVKPGITGWAQVNGLRGEVDTLDKARARVDHDLYYIEHWSPWFDLKILFKTTFAIINRPAY
jgi:Undecaprenyl-phosphate glucose phosphotransferase